MIRLVHLLDNEVALADLREGLAHKVLVDLVIYLNNFLQVAVLVSNHMAVKMKKLILFSILLIVTKGENLNSNMSDMISAELVMDLGQNQDPSR